MKKAILIVNPCAGKLKARTALFDITDTLCRNGVIPAIYTTSAPGDAARSAALYGDMYDMVICCGGDGTLSEVVNGIMRTQCVNPIGYIPCGTTNDFAASSGIPKEPDRAARLAATGNATLCDIGLFCGERYFSYIASFGAFTKVAYTTPQLQKNTLGHLAYVVEAIKSAADIVPYKMNITIDGKRFSGDYIYGSVSNTTSIGGIIHFDPSLVDKHDGLFEVMLIRKPESTKEAQGLLRALTHAGEHCCITYARGREISLESAQPLAWTLDGEITDDGSDFSIVCVKDAVRIIMD